MRITRALCAFEWLTAHRARYYAALFTVFGVVAASARNGNAAGPLAGTQQTTPSKPGTGAVQSAGVTSPTVIREVKPRYTLAAQRAKIEGTVGLECIVGKDGTVVDVHVVRSLDPTFGLDDEAVKAARQWLFRPGTRNGEPVPVLIKMELSFHLNNTPSPVPLGAESTQQVQPPAGFPAVGAPPIVALISTGTEPRKALRFVIANGHREHMTIDTTMTMTVTMGDNSMPEMKLPLLRIGVDLEVMAVSNTGDMTILTTFTDASWIPTPGSDPATLTRLNSTAAGLKGLSGTTVMSDRAVVRDMKFDTSKIFDPQLSQTMATVLQAMQNQALPLPEEPVGVGATWEVRLGLKANGLQTFNKYAVQLTAMDDTSCTLKVALDQTAPPQSISNPALAGATTSVDALSSTGNGTTTIQFDTLAPTTEVNVNGKTTMNIDIGGNRRQMNTVMSMKLTVTPGVVK